MKRIPRAPGSSFRCQLAIEGAVGPDRVSKIAGERGGVEFVVGAESHAGEHMTLSGRATEFLEGGGKPINAGGGCPEGGGVGVERVPARVFAPAVTSNVYCVLVSSVCIGFRTMASPAPLVLTTAGTEWRSPYDIGERNRQSASTHPPPSR